MKNVRKRKSVWTRMGVLLVVAVIVMMSGTVSADWANFFGTIDDDWSVSGNWDPAGVFPPTLITGVAVSTTAGAVIYPGTDAKANNIWISPGWGDASSLTVGGGTLEATEYIEVGAGGGPSVFTVDGLVDVGLWLTVGGSAVGTMNMNDGTLNTGSLGVGGGAYGLLTVNGGRINTDSLEFNVWGGPGGAIDFPGGIAGDGLIVIYGDQLDEVRGWVTAGWITGIGVDEVQLIEGKTMFPIPEPATLALLGFGSMVLLRRRK